MAILWAFQASIIGSFEVPGLFFNYLLISYGGRRAEGRSRAANRLKEVREESADRGEEATDLYSYRVEKEEAVLISRYSPDRKTIKYLEDLVKPHEYWDKRPMLREDMEQQWGNVEGKREVKDVQKEPLKLPKEDLYWCEVNVMEEK